MSSEHVRKAEELGVKFADHLSDSEKDWIARWYLKKRENPEWVAEIKSRSDEADEWLRRRGLLGPSNSTQALVKDSPRGGETA